MKFCEVCNNMLQPRENREQKKLEYVCKSTVCNYVDKSDTAGGLVFRNDIVKDTATNLRSILSDVNKDPTLSRVFDEECAQCGQSEAVVFMAEQTAKSTALQLIHVCVACGNKWFAQGGVVSEDAGAMDA